MAARSVPFFERRPVVSALVLFVVDLAIIALAGAAAKALGVGGMKAGFVALCVETVFVVAVLGGLRWWREAGFNRPSEWRELKLLWVPAAVLVVLPLIVGLHALAPATAAYLVAYALTGFTEEAWFRGVLLRVLGTIGVRRAVLLSAVLFGASHLVNVLFRSNPFLVLAQAVDAFSEGVGFGAIRLRTNTIWPLIVLHGFEDLLLRFTRLPPIPVNVFQSVVLLVYGVYLLRNMRGGVERPGLGTPERPRVV
jgi:hypothetical protein